MRTSPFGPPYPIRLLGDLYLPGPKDDWTLTLKRNGIHGLASWSQSLKIGDRLIAWHVNGKISVIMYIDAPTGDLMIRESPARP